MCKQTIYNLRLSNIAPNNTNLVTLSSDKSEYSVRIPAWLRSKGKCNITVQNVIIQTKNGTGTSVVPSNAHTAVVEVDGLNLLGYSNQNGSQALTLCEIPIDSNQNDITLVNPYTFTSLNIESSVTIKRKCYNPTNENISVSLNNNKIKFKEGAQAYVELTIATGTYSLDDLLATLKTQLEAQSSTWGNTYTYTLTHTGNNSVTISNTGNDGIFDFSGTNTCRLFLGLSKTIHTISNISVSLNNNKIKFKEGAQAYVELTIATGAYSLATLLATLKTMLETQSNTWGNNYTYTLTHDAGNGTVTITNTGNEAVFDFSGTNTCRLFLGFSKTIHTISTVAGITSDIALEALPASSITSDIPVDILDSFLPIPMNEYTDIVVPMVVNLSLEFEED